jgi:hypothetical protein
MLACLDEGLSNITSTLGATGLLHDTIVIASNDNGGMSGSYVTTAVAVTVTVTVTITVPSGCASSHMVWFVQVRHGLLQLRHVLRRPELPVSLQLQ